MLRQRGRVIDPRVGRQITAMRRAVIAQERERCAKYIETNGRGKCVSDDSAKALAAAIRGGE